MRHVTDLSHADPPGPTIVAVGMFDGVHRGHQHLLRRLVETARAAGYTPAVLTFFRTRTRCWAARRAAII